MTNNQRLTDREMLWFVYGSIKLASAKLDQFNEIVDILEEHLYPHLYPPQIANQVVTPEPRSE